MSEDHDHEATGRDAVRLHFVDRLARAGLKPYGKQTVAQHEAMMKDMVDFLSYLSVPSLITLADEVIEAAVQAKGVCPSEIAIRTFARGKEDKPFELKPIVTSWLASIEGPKAEAGGYLAQLFRHLRQHPRPVMAYDLRQIQQQAEDDRRREAMIIDREHLASPEDRRWRAEMAEDLRQAREIIDRAARARAAKQQGQGAAA